MSEWVYAWVRGWVRVCLRRFVRAFDCARAISSYDCMKPRACVSIFPPFPPFSVIPLGLASGIPEVFPVPFAALPTLRPAKLFGALGAANTEMLFERRLTVGAIS